MGRHMCELFAKHSPVRYDVHVGAKEAVNGCDLAFVCVPTNSLPNGGCDTSIVEDVVSWLKCETVVFRSTVPPGTCERLAEKSGLKIVMNPEYVGETVSHPLSDTTTRQFLILGGTCPEATRNAVRAYQMVYNASVHIMQVTAREAEVIKYCENSFIGTYVTFCNQMYDVCEAFDVDWSVVREGFLMDPRMTPYWTFVYPERRGFDGKCIPKDMRAIVRATTDAGGDARFLQSVLDCNEEYLKARK